MKEQSVATCCNYKTWTLLIGGTAERWISVSVRKSRAFLNTTGAPQQLGMVSKDRFQRSDNAAVSPMNIQSVHPAPTSPIKLLYEKAFNFHTSSDWKSKNWSNESDFRITFGVIKNDIESSDGGKRILIHSIAMKRKHVTEVKSCTVWSE